MVRKYDVNEISDLLKDIDKNELGQLRSLMSDYVTSNDHRTDRLLIEECLGQIKIQYGDNIYQFFRDSLSRIIEHKNIYILEDMCDHKQSTFCDEKACNGYQLSCNLYTPLKKERGGFVE